MSRKITPVDISLEEPNLCCRIIRFNALEYSIYTTSEEYPYGKSY